MKFWRTHEAIRETCHCSLTCCAGVLRACASANSACRGGSRPAIRDEGSCRAVREEDRCAKWRPVTDRAGISGRKSKMERRSTCFSPRMRSIQQQLVTAGVADAASLIRVCARAPGAVGAGRTKFCNLPERGFDALKDPRVAKIAIANPEHAPYGRAAVAALQKAGLYDELKAQVGVWRKYFAGGAICAVRQRTGGNHRAVADVCGKHEGRGTLGNSGDILSTDLQQKAVIVNASSNKAAAQAFLEFVKSDEGRKILSNYGLTPPETATKP